MPQGWPYQPSTICGPDTPMPQMKRPPPASASTVAADMAALAGVRAASWMIAVPSLMRLVLPARKASGVTASEP